jgi:GNAT superfamily N-acetyltransferase
MSGDALIAKDVVVRSYQDNDEPAVLDLLRGSLGGGPAGQRSAEFFRWKHLENPFGRSFMIVAEHDRQIIGFRALMRWRFRIGERTIEAVRPVDTVTHPDHRGRGVFSMLTRTALDSLQGQVDLVFNTPNSNSLPGYLKMGWHVVGRVPVWIRVCRPASFVTWKLRRASSSESAPSLRPTVEAATAADALRHDAAIASLLGSSEVPAWGYSTPRSVSYLRWRYGSAPLLGYHAVLEERSGDLIGMAFFRLRPDGPLWGALVADVIVRPGDVATARKLLRAARRAAEVSYVATSFPKGTAAARAAHGPTSLRAPRRMTFVVNPLQPNMDPDPQRFSSWALSTGDVEVF